MRGLILVMAGVMLLSACAESTIDGASSAWTVPPADADAPAAVPVERIDESASADSDASGDQCVAFAAAVVGRSSRVGSFDPTEANAAIAEAITPFDAAIADRIVESFSADAPVPSPVTLAAYDDADRLIMDACGFPGMSGLMAVAGHVNRHWTGCLLGSPEDIAGTAPGCRDGDGPNFPPCYSATGLQFAEYGIPYLPVNCDTGAAVDWDYGTGAWIDASSDQPIEPAPEQFTVVDDVIG